MRKVIATQHFFEFPDLNSEIDGIYFVSNRHKKSNTIWCWTFCIEGGFEQLNAARMSAAGDGSTEPNLYFCPVGRNANESVLPCSNTGKAVLSECPVDTRYQPGFSAEKRIRPPPPQKDQSFWIGLFSIVLRKVNLTFPFLCAIFGK